jgi:hypothetical protein
MVTLNVPVDSELSRLLRAADASGEPLRVDTGGVVYTLRIHERTPHGEPSDVWAGYDPERVFRAFDQATGILAGVDRDQLLTDLAAQREQDSHGRPR